MKEHWTKRLKRENEELKADLHAVVMEPKGVRALLVEVRVKAMANVAKMLWA